MPNPSRRTVLAGLSALAVAPLLAACGSDDSDGGDAANQQAAGAEENAFPVTVTHKFGETTIEAAPQRVVCVGLTDQDALLAVDVAPVAVTKWFGDAAGMIFPWAKPKLGDRPVPQVLDATNGVPVEKVAALKPDLIVGTYSGLTRKEYDLLSKLAPVVAQNGKYADYGTPWDESATEIGKAVGKSAAMQKVVDEVKARIAADAAANPEFKGKSALVVTPYEGLFVYGPEDPRSRMLTDLGFTFPETAFGGDKTEFGKSISAERTSDLDKVDLVVWLDLTTDKNVKSVFDKTSTATQGHWFDVDKNSGDYYIGHSFVTPLSIPWVLDRYVPQLKAAADDDPKTVPPTVKS